MHPIMPFHGAHLVCLMILSCVFSGSAWGSQQDGISSEEQVLRLRAPWALRAVDYGTFPPDSIRVVSDGDRGQAERLLQRVRLVRELSARWFGGFPLRRPDAPRLLVFERPEDMLFTLRTDLAVRMPRLPALAVLRSDGPDLAVTTGYASELGLERAVQREAFLQFLMPRCAGTLPPWARYGLAECFGAMLVHGGRLGHGHQPPDLVAPLTKALLGERLVPFDRLIRLDEAGWDHFESVHGAALMRSQAWSLVQFLLHGGTEDLARRFLRWVELACAGNDPVDSLESVLSTMPGGASLEELGAAWRNTLAGLEPGALHLAIERAELLRACLEEIEAEGLRPADPVALMKLIADRDEVRHVMRSGLFSSSLSSHRQGWLDPSVLEFIAPVVRGGQVASDAIPPPEVWIRAVDGWDLGVTWARIPDRSRWFPRVERRPTRR
ncbi:MAG: hypothetical protein MK082_05885 [Phycisphaerales bacterium]|nr:hypothetical protein [Phycisphaerales bacterium]